MGRRWRRAKAQRFAPHIVPRLLIVAGANSLEEKIHG
jgi:hypothetical protein